MLSLAGGVVAAMVYGSMVVAEPSEGRRLVADLGLTPSAFAACGFDATACAAVLQRISSSSHRSTITALKSSLSEQERLVNEIAKREREGQTTATPESTPTLAEARAAVLQSKGELRMLLDQLFQAALDETESTLRTRLTNFRNSGASGIPAEFRVVAWNATELADLQRALVAEQRATQRRDELTSEHRTVLETVRAREDVAAAKAALTANLNLISQQFASSLGY